MVELNTDIQNMEPMTTVNITGISCSRLKKWSKSRSLSLSKVSKIWKTESSENDVIYKSVSVAIDFRCEYDNIYKGIETNNIVVSGDNFETDVENGDGDFKFTLRQYRDSNFTDETQSNDITKLGSKLFFQLAMENPVSGLSYSLMGKDFSSEVENNWILDCNVYNEHNANQTFPVVKEYCVDSDFVSSSVQMNGALQEGVSLTFPSFKFTGSEDDKIELKLQCSVCKIYYALIILQ